MANAVDAAVVHLDLPYVTAEQEAPLGTGDAARVGLAALPDAFDGIVIVTAADVPLLDSDTLRGLVAAHTSGDNPAVVTLTSFIADEPTGYGRIIRTNDGSVQAIVEEKDATDAQQAITEVNAGIYAFDVGTLRAALAQLLSLIHL